MDDVLIDTITLSGSGRLTFDHAEGCLVHTRTTGTRTPIVATAAQVRALMTILVLQADEPPADRSTLSYGVELLLGLLDRHPVRAVLGWEHLRDAATDPHLTSAGDALWGSTG